MLLVMGVICCVVSRQLSKTGDRAPNVQVVIPSITIISAPVARNFLFSFNSTWNSTGNVNPTNMNKRPLPMYCTFFVYLALYISLCNPLPCYCRCFRSCSKNIYCCPGYMSFGSVNLSLGSSQKSVEYLKLKCTVAEIICIMYNFCESNR